MLLRAAGPQALDVQDHNGDTPLMLAEALPVSVPILNLLHNYSTGTSSDSPLHRDHFKKDE